MEDGLKEIKKQVNELNGLLTKKWRLIARRHAMRGITLS